MSDIVERLLAYADEWNEPETSQAPVREAADEIVRLRAELDTKTMNWLANNVSDKGEILRAEIKAAEARDEIVQLRGEVHLVNKAMDLTVRKIIKVEAERDRLRASVQWYCDYANKKDADVFADTVARATAAEAERDRLREALLNLRAAFISFTQWNGDPPPVVMQADAALKGDTP